MTSRMTRLQMLRQERRPLVALTALAFAMRLALLILASALTPDAAAAAGLTSLCQSSKLEQNLPAGHDPLSCHCGPVCAHGCALGPCLSAETSETDNLPLAATAKLAVTLEAAPRPFAGHATAIRGPPVSLI